MNDKDLQPEGYDLNEPIDPVDEPHPSEEPAVDEFAEAPPTSVAPTTVYCVQCGYNLTGVAIGSTCPECGRTVAPSFHGQTLPISGKSVAALVLGICSIFMCMFYGLPAIIVGALAVIFANLSKKQVARGEAGGTSAGFATTGTVCGIIGIVLGVLYIAILIIIFASM